MIKSVSGFRPVFKSIDCDGYFDEEHANGKTLVCGHWRASDFYNAFGQADLNNIEKNDTFISDKVIALDATTAISRQVNVFVIEE